TGGTRPPCRGACWAKPATSSTRGPWRSPPSCGREEAVVESVIRVAIVYLFVLFALRLLGKREFGDLSPHEFVMLMLIPDIVAQGIVKEDFSLTNGLVAVSTIMLLVALTSLLIHVSRPGELAVTPRPTVLLFDGNLYTSNLNKERVSADEVLQVARESGLETLDQVKWAILQPDGKIAIVPKEAASERRGRQRRAAEALRSGHDDPARTAPSARGQGQRRGAAREREGGDGPRARPRRQRQRHPRPRHRGG